jgi:RimJ/RimL family protein N-acetyltransferase
MFARTERLLLRPAWREDAPALAEAIGDFSIVRNLSRAPWPYGLDDAESFVGIEPGPLPRLLIFARTNGAPRLVGGIGLNAPESEDGAPELGYWIARPYWGLGFATEAARAVVDIADRALRLPQLAARHFADNPASGHVLAKLGFEPVGEAMTMSKARSSLEPSIVHRRQAFAQGKTPVIEHADREDALAA